MFRNEKHHHHSSDEFFLGNLEAHSHSRKPSPEGGKAEEIPAAMKPEKDGLKRKKPLRAKRTPDGKPEERKTEEKQLQTETPKRSNPFLSLWNALSKRGKKETPRLAETQGKDKESSPNVPNTEEVVSPALPSEEEQPSPAETSAEETKKKASAPSPKPNKKKPLTKGDWLRYSVLFVCLFGFFTAGYFVFSKLYGYYRAHVIYSGLQEMVAVKDRFSDEYLKKALSSGKTLTPEDILAGKNEDVGGENTSFSQEQETLVGKISQLKKINPDTVGWIAIDKTVVNYPMVWSQTEDYYLKRDFYGKKLASGTIFLDARNSPDITKNRNTVIYGHNMSDGSMFASLHDFSSASVFYNTKIQITTEMGVFIYTPFSVHQSNAYDNYFETNFVSDDDYLNFCEQMAFISMFESEVTFTKDSQIITLSTCMDNQSATDGRFAVHAILTQVIR